MGSGRLVFDPSRRGGVLVLGSGDDPVLRGWRSEGDSKRARSFFTSPEEVLEEEYYYEEQLPEKKRRLTPEQVDLLERSFEAENKLEPERKSELAKKLGVQPRQVAIWFQNRRARWKTKQLEQDFCQLKSSYDALLAEHHSLLKDNNCLRSQVVCLTDKLQAVESMGLKLGEDQAPSSGNNTALNTELNVEDCLSTRSGRSTVLGEKAVRQLIDSSGDSYFPEDYRELDCSVRHDVDAGCNSLSGVLQQQHAEEVSQLGWWVGIETLNFHPSPL